MLQLELKDGLLYTSVKLTHEGKSIIVKDMIVDTGAFHTIISTDYLEQIDVAFSEDDELVRATGYGGAVSYSVRKKVDSLSCGDIGLSNIKLDFGVVAPDEEFGGLLGLDFLRQAETVLDLKELILYSKS
jgi:predicted aspartyl protease